jgi:hypothetical protein
VLPFVNDEGMLCPVRTEPISIEQGWYVAHQRSLFKARLAFSWADSDKSLFGCLVRQNVQMQRDSLLKGAVQPETTAAAVAFRKKEGWVIHMVPLPLR